MRELFVDTCAAVGEDGGAVEYDYFILIEELPGGLENYGVKITEHGISEGTVVPGVTADFSRINELIAMLTRNVVTPTGLPDVLADWL